MEPFVPTKKKVCIVGFASTTRDQTPWDDPEFEIWTLNEAANKPIFPWIKRQADRWFQIHPKWDFERSDNGNDFNHYLWLKNESGQCNECNGSKKLMFVNDPKKEPIDCTGCGGTGIYHPPAERNLLKVIYMQKAYPEIPGSVKYPLVEVTKKIMPELGGYKYYLSSFAYMLGLAAYMGFEQINVCGFEMGSNSEYHYQRANAEYLIGLLQGKGYNIHLPVNTILLKGKLYGYENMKLGYRHQLEMRANILRTQLAQVEHKQADFEGRLKILQDNSVKYPETAGELETAYSQYLRVMSTVNLVKGALRETQNLTGLYDKYFVADTEAGDVESPDLIPSEEDRNKNLEISYVPQEL